MVVVEDGGPVETADGKSVNSGRERKEKGGACFLLLKPAFQTTGCGCGTRTRDCRERRMTKKESVCWPAEAVGATRKGFRSSHHKEEKNDMLVPRSKRSDTLSCIHTPAYLVFLGRFFFFPWRSLSLNSTGCLVAASCCDSLPYILGCRFFFLYLKYVKYLLLF